MGEHQYEVPAQYAGKGTFVKFNAIKGTSMRKTAFPTNHKNQ